jgi:hypothetical protein
MATDLTVVLENRPGTLAQLGEALGNAGINIIGGCGFQSGGEGVIHLLVEDAEQAKMTLQGAGIEVRDERPVLVTSINDRPGELGRLTRRIAKAGVNIDLIYLTAGGQLVLGVDDPEKARAAL